MKRSKATFWTLILILTVFNSSAFPQENPVTLHILYTQNNNGEINNCHCPSNPLGGFEKRHTFLTRWLSDHPNTLLFDSGDFLSFDGDMEQDFNVISLMDRMSYSAVNIGDQELSNGLQFLEEYILSSPIPLISSNLMIDSPKPKLYKRYITFEKAGVRIAVTGVVGPDNVKYYTEMSGESLLWCVNPEKALQIVHDNQAEVREADLTILLSNLGLDNDLNLVNEISFLDVIIGGHSQHLLDEPIKKKGALIVQCGKDGHHVGHLEITIQDGEIIEYMHAVIPMDMGIEDSQDIIELIKGI